MNILIYRIFFFLFILRKKKLFSFTLFLFIFNSFFSFLDAQVIYVTQNGTGNGSSWQNAQSDLVSALAKARPNTQIWVAKGIFYPTQCTNCGVPDRRKSFNIPEGVSLIGGFNGNETLATQRDLKNNKTILSGDIDRDGLPNKNSYSVIYTFGVSAKTIVDGFTITAGYANDTTAAGEIYSSGGGWYNDCRDTVSSPTIRNCNFLSNYALTFGGGLINNMFRGKCNSQVLNCTFANNYSHSVGGGVNNFAVDNGICTAHFEFCNFISNVSDEGGAAVSNDGERGSNLSVFSNCTFIKNECPYSDSVITYGGAMYNLGKNGNSSPVITNCLFWANKAYGGAMYCLGAFKGKSNPQITNCIFYKNEAHTCGTVYSNAGDTTGTASPSIVNSILWKNKAYLGRIFRNNYGTPRISYSIVDTASCAALNSGVGSGVVCGNGMVYNEDPIFTDPDNGDFRFKAGSPAINSGNTSVITGLALLYDLDSLPRIVQNIVDMGCYEFTGLKFFQPEIVTHPTDKAVCEKTNTFFKVKASGTQPLIYDWYKNDTLYKPNGSDTLFLNNVSSSTSGNYKCIVRNNIGQVAPTFSGNLLVQTLLPVSVSMETITLPACEGDSITLRARTVNGGKTQRIIWLLNSVSLGLPDSLTRVTLMAGSKYFKYNCTLISSEICVQQNSVPSNIVNVVDLLKPSVTATLALSVNRASYCVGDKVRLEATGDYWGYTPQIDWFKNGKSLNFHQSYLIIDSLRRNDTVSVKIISSESCSDKFTPTNQFVNLRSDNCQSINNSSKLEPKIFPNPSTVTRLTIEKGDWSGQLRIDILTQTGSLVQSIEIPEADQQNSFDIETNVTSNGFYFIRLSNETASKVFKWVFIKE